MGNFWRTLTILSTALTMLVPVPIPADTRLSADEKIEIYLETLRAQGISTARAQLSQKADELIARLGGRELQAGETGAVGYTWAALNTYKSARSCEDAKSDAQKYLRCSEAVGNLLSFVPGLAQYVGIVLTAQSTLTGPIIEKMAEDLVAIYQYILSLETQILESEYANLKSQAIQTASLLKEMDLRSSRVVEGAERLVRCQTDQRPKISEYGECLNILYQLRMEHLYELHTARRLLELLNQYGAALRFFESEDEAKQFVQDHELRIRTHLQSLENTEQVLLRLELAYLELIALNQKQSNDESERQWRCQESLRLTEQPLLKLASKLTFGSGKKFDSNTSVEFLALDLRVLKRRTAAAAEVCGSDTRLKAISEELMWIEELLNRRGAK